MRNEYEPYIFVKESGRNWNICLNKRIQEFEFREMRMNHKYVIASGRTIASLVMYMDNIQFIGNDVLT